MAFKRIVLGMLLALAVLIAAAVAWSWAPDRSLESLKKRWAPSPSQFISVQGMQVHVRDEGPRNDPEPIVLLHGTSSSLHTWDGWAQSLSGTRRVIRVDLPGFGLTGPNPSGDYRLPAYEQFMVAVLDHFNLKHVVLGGNSFGGEVAWKTALAEPDRVRRLVLVNAGGYPFRTDNMPIGFKIAQVPALRPVMAKLLPRNVIESSVRNVYGDPSQVTPELIDRYHELTLRAGNRHALGERFAQAPIGQYAQDIQKVKQPTLVMWGGQDRLISPDHAASFQRDIVGSKLVMFDDLGHVPHEEDPAVTVAAAKAFLASPE